MEHCLGSAVAYKGTPVYDRAVRHAVGRYHIIRVPADAVAPDNTLAVRFYNRQIGAIAKPKEIRFTDALPKTRSGKIMRRLLRDIASGREEIGDTSTLEDYSVLSHLRESEEA